MKALAPFVSRRLRHRNCRSRSLCEREQMDRKEMVMRTSTALALAAAGGVIAFRLLPRQSRDRLTSSARHRMLTHMEHMMASLPDDAPPKLVMSVLPKLKAQNEEIIALLREQTELLRQEHATAH
jgi:hypothetical protein